jgi:hypothetical protein
VVVQAGGICLISPHCPFPEFIDARPGERMVGLPSKAVLGNEAGDRVSHDAENSCEGPVQKVPFEQRSVHVLGETAVRPVKTIERPEYSAAAKFHPVAPVQVVLLDRRARRCRPPLSPERQPAASRLFLAGAAENAVQPRADLPRPGREHPADFCAVAHAVVQPPVLCTPALVLGQRQDLAGL